MNAADYTDLFIGYMKAEKRASENTLKSYATDIAGFFDCVDDGLPVAVGDINTLLVRRWIAEMSKNGLSPRSINRKISALSSFFKYLMRKKVIVKNPVNGIVKPKTAKKLPAFITEEKIAATLDCVPENEDYTAFRNRTVLELFYATGVRISELTNLKTGDIDFAQRQIRIFGKGGKERFVPMTANVQEKLNRYLTLRREMFPNPADALFLSSRGKGMNVKSIYLGVKTYLRSGGITGKCNPHVLRHTFATHLLNSGADLNSLKELLGHATLTATQVYTHNTFEKLKNIYNNAHPRAQV